MRKRNQKQMPLTPTSVDHPHGMELKLISRILDDISTINELAWQELTHRTQNPRLIFTNHGVLLFNPKKQFNYPKYMSFLRHCC